MHTTPNARRYFMARSIYLAATGLSAASASFSGFAQTTKNTNTTPSRPLLIAQIVDTSVSQQDVSKDFLIGARAAMAIASSDGAVRGRALNHWVLETDGSPASAQRAWVSVRDNPQCVALMGTTADPLAMQISAWVKQDNVPLAHAAPWLQSSQGDLAEGTFGLFANRQQQIAHAMRSLSTLGTKDIAAVFASASHQQLYASEVAAIARKEGLTVQSFTPTTDLTQLGRRLDAKTPAVILFLGGTPELAQLTQGLDKQARQRYVVALADVNLQTLRELGAMRSTPIIGTQAVPMVTSSLPLVRNYRQAMAKLFDEPLNSLSLAGYMAARYTIETIAAVDGTANRASVLAAFSRNAVVDLGGLNVAAAKGSNGSPVFVTQTMLTSDGRFVG